MTGVDKDLATLREFLTAVEPTGNVELIYTSALPRVVPVRAALARVEAELSRLREGEREAIQSTLYWKGIATAAEAAEAKNAELSALIVEQEAEYRKEKRAAEAELRECRDSFTEVERVAMRVVAAEARCARLQQELEQARECCARPPGTCFDPEALAGPDTPAPKARRESTYTVSWERRDYPEYGHLSCSGLTGRVAFARLIGAVKNSGPVVIHKIEREEGE